MPRSTSAYISQPLDVRATTLARLREQGYEWKEIADMLETSESVVYRDQRRANLAKERGRGAARRDLIVRNAERGVCYGSMMRGFTNVPQEDPLAAMRALQLCTSCPIKDLCWEIVDPMHFDGVCGGQMYHNGKVVTLEVMRLAKRRVKLVKDERGKYQEVSTKVTCWCGGTRYGRNRHMARNEKPCPWSARAHADYERERAGLPEKPDEYVVDWANVRGALKGDPACLNKKEKVATIIVLTLLEQSTEKIMEHAGVRHEGTVRKYRMIFGKGEMGFDDAEERTIADLVQEFGPSFA